MLYFVNYEEATNTEEAALVVATGLTPDKIVVVNRIRGKEAESLYLKMVGLTQKQYDVLINQNKKRYFKGSKGEER